MIIDFFRHFTVTANFFINGDYQICLDGEVVGSGSGLYKGGMIKHGSTLVIGKDQDVVGRKFDPNRSRIAEVYMSGLNLWGLVQSKSDIIPQYRNCYVRTPQTPPPPPVAYENQIKFCVCVCQDQTALCLVRISVCER